MARRMLKFSNNDKNEYGRWEKSDWNSENDVTKNLITESINKYLKEINDELNGYTVKQIISV